MISHNYFNINNKLTLNQKETELFSFLMQFINQQSINVTLRVAGGWVRDKLLSLESHDIDIALDTMMGEAFVQQLDKYMQAQGEKMKGFGIIKANCDQSKHLETATCRIKGIDVDFVNLRGEEYTNNSRIPTIVFGTPLQDAERRDLTINSLFYNINENKIEDFTQKGIEDLSNGLIRTPLDPYKTFSDDPLRILRCFRFAAKFNYKIQDDIINTIQLPQIKQDLKQKVSQERVRAELEKMLRGPNPMLSLQLIYQNNIWDIVFQIPQQCQQVDNINVQSLNNLSYQLAQKSFDRQEEIFNLQILKQYYLQNDIQLYLYLSACCQSYQNLTYLYKKKEISVVYFIIQECLKFSNKEMKIVTLICQQIQIAQNLINLLESNLIYIETVKFIKNSGDLWELILFLAELADQIYLKQNSQQYIHLKNYIDQYQLNHIFDLKTIINGQEVKNLFKIDKGPQIKQILDNIYLWQVQNPEKSKEQLLAEIAQNQTWFENNNQL